MNSVYSPPSRKIGVILKTSSCGIRPVITITITDVGLRGSTNSILKVNASRLNCPFVNHCCVVSNGIIE